MSVIVAAFFFTSRKPNYLNKAVHTSYHERAAVVSLNVIELGVGPSQQQPHHLLLPQS